MINRADLRRGNGSLPRKRGRDGVGVRRYARARPLTPSLTLPRLRGREKK
jgi:hypothetical protein